jgi:beta-glucosidase
MTFLRFPEGFRFGLSTSAHQIEGYSTADGGGRSIWDHFAHTEGTTQDGDTADVACDHYHRWREDIGLMEQLGLKNYSFSLAWPRILPQGTGRLNPAGLDFYDRLVDRLLEAGIAPTATLYHWDLPVALQQLGGWLNRSVVDWFADYATIAFARLGDRVQQWVTINEPQVVAMLGHVGGQHAPGLRDLWGGLRVSHHLMLAHAEAVSRYRATGQSGQIGIKLVMGPADPASDQPADIAAAGRADAWGSRLFLDPLLRGSYPDILLERFPEAWSCIHPGDLERILDSLDFLGIDYYFRSVIAEGSGQMGVKHLRGPGPRTAMDWEIWPQGLRDLLLRLARDYPPIPLYVMESGAAFEDTLEGGRVHDRARQEYLASHLAAAHQAIAQGAPLQGYFVWSLMDNFEWAYGYAKRFGLIYVDYPTQQRILKDSALWYREVMQRGGLEFEG